MKNNKVVDINTYKLQKQLNQVVMEKFQIEKFEVDYKKQLNKSFPQLVIALRLHEKDGES